MQNFVSLIIEFLFCMTKTTPSNDKGGKINVTINKYNSLTINSVLVKEQ